MSDKEKQGPTGGLIPHIVIPERQAANAIEFYKQAFGAQEEMRMLAEDGQRVMHAHLLINGGSLMLCDDFPEHGHVVRQPLSNSMTLHLQVDDADQWFARAVKAGAVIRMPVDDMFWGDRYGQVQDPYGLNWAMGSPSKGNG